MTRSITSQTVPYHVEYLMKIRSTSCSSLHTTSLDKYIQILLSSPSGILVSSALSTVNVKQSRLNTNSKLAANSAVLFTPVVPEIPQITHIDFGSNSLAAILQWKTNESSKNLKPYVRVRAALGSWVSLTTFISPIRVRCTDGNRISFCFRRKREKA